MRPAAHTVDAILFDRTLARSVSPYCQRRTMEGLTQAHRRNPAAARSAVVLWSTIVLGLSRVDSETGLPSEYGRRAR